MREQFERRTFLILLVIVSLGFGLILKPFWTAIFWACALAVVFAPLQHRFEQWWGVRPNINALATLLMCMLIVVLPIIFVTKVLVQEGLQLYQLLESGAIVPRVILIVLREAFPLVVVKIIDMVIYDMNIR